MKLLILTILILTSSYAHSAIPADQPSKSEMVDESEPKEPLEPIEIYVVSCQSADSGNWEDKETTSDLKVAEEKIEAFTALGLYCQYTTEMR